MCELFVPERGHQVDIVLSSSERTAIDILGPTHYRFGNRLKLCTAMKHRQIRAAGWGVLTMPWWEWPTPTAETPAEVSAELKHDYLRHLLASDERKARSLARQASAYRGVSSRQVKSSL